MKINYKAFFAGVFFAIGIATLAWALTTDQIWQSVYDSSTTSIRIEQVSGS